MQYIGSTIEVTKCYIDKANRVIYIRIIPSGGSTLIIRTL